MKLSDIKDADGKNELIPMRVLGVYTYNELSQRQVAIVCDKEKLALAIHRTIFNKEMEEDTMIRNLEIYGLADAIIAHKEELFKIIYVKD